MQRMEGPQWLLLSVLMATIRCLALASLEDSAPPNPGSPDSPPGASLPCHKISVSNIDFAFSLYRQLAPKAPGANILFSPASVSLAGAMLLQDAPAASRTQLLQGLGFNLSALPEPEVQEAFRDLLTRLPGRDPRLLVTLEQRRATGLSSGAGHARPDQNVEEEQARATLGAWAEDLASDTEALLANHVLLRAAWARPFDPGATGPKDFFVGERRAVRVPTMTQSAGHRLLHDPELRCTVLQLGHAGNASTFFVLPRPGTLAQLEAALGPETLIRWDDLLRTRELEFHFPQLSVSSSYRLEERLPRVAVGVPGQPALHILKVTHKAMLRLDEAGLEVTAATGVQLASRSPPHVDPILPPDAEAYRPFLVMTFHLETGSMLLLGRIVNPWGDGAPLRG